MSFPWDELLSESEKEVIRRAGYGNRTITGTRPAFLVIDAQYNFFGARKPLLDQVDDFPTGIGIGAWNSLDHSRKVLSAARNAGIPVIFTRYVAQGGPRSHESRMSRDHSKFEPGSMGSEIVEELSPISGETVIDKNYASAFFGTPLINHLVGKSVDSLIIIGGTTSGCVRSTAIDASNYGFNAILVSDCVFDRIEVSHKVALLDIWMKYGSVTSAQDAVEYLKNIEKLD